MDWRAALLIIASAAKQSKDCHGLAAQPATAPVGRARMPASALPMMQWVGPALMLSHNLTTTAQTGGQRHEHTHRRTHQHRLVPPALQSPARGSRAPEY